MTVFIRKSIAIFTSFFTDMFEQDQGAIDKRQFKPGQDPISNSFAFSLIFFTTLFSRIFMTLLAISEVR
jgi:hypothetical protein